MQPTIMTAPPKWRPILQESYAHGFDDGYEQAMIDRIGAELWNNQDAELRRPS